MWNRWPVRRVIVVVAGGLALAALAAFLWANGQTDSGLYCSTAYPETNGNTECGIQDVAGPVFIAAGLVAVFTLVAELFTPRTAARH